VGRVDRQLAEVVLLVAVENPVGGGAEPGVDLAWGRDPLSLIDKAIAGGLDRLLDPLFGGVGVKSGERSLRATQGAGLERAAPTASTYPVFRLCNPAVSIRIALGLDRAAGKSEALRSSGRVDPLMRASRDRRLLDQLQHPPLDRSLLPGRNGSFGR
jgi:hypothetical protein